MPRIWKEIAAGEFSRANQAGLQEILKELNASGKEGAASDNVKMPPKVICTAQIPGIEVMDLEDAVKTLEQELVRDSSEEEAKAALLQKSAMQRMEKKA